jgi:hypothetical protein
VNLLLRLLLDPGRSFAGYVLRMTVIMLVGGFAISLVIGYLRPEEMIGAQNQARENLGAVRAILISVLLTPALSAVVVWSLVRTIGLAVKGPLVIALIIALLGGLAFAGFASPIYGLVGVWMFFLTAIACQVGALSSLQHALLAPFAVLALYDASVYVIDAFILRS